MNEREKAPKMSSSKAILGVEGDLLLGQRSDITALSRRVETCSQTAPLFAHSAALFCSHVCVGRLTSPPPT